MKFTPKHKEATTRDDLEWRFCSSDAACGLSSNWYAMVSAAHFGGSSHHEPSFNVDLAHISKRRRIDQAYSSLDPMYQNVLFASFSMQRYDYTLTKLFRKHTGAALSLPISGTPADLQALCNRINNGKATTLDKVLITNIRIQAETAYWAAINAYIEAKKA